VPDVATAECNAVNEEALDSIPITIVDTPLSPLTTAAANGKPRNSVSKRKQQRQQQQHSCSSSVLHDARTNVNATTTTVASPEHHHVV
jgi:hypothetical protein